MDFSKLINKKDYRYERKFFVDSIENKEVFLHIKTNPYHFKEIYDERKINNIYLDTSSMDCYNDNVEGLSERYKIRIRWYGDTFGKTENPKLEIKTKINELGGKIIYDLPSFNISKGFSRNDFINIIKKSHLPEKMKVFLYNYNLSLLNSYTRKYFLSNDKKYRITVDNKLCYYKIENRNNKFSNIKRDYDNCILELKYNLKSEENADKISNLFPYRMSKSSKYVMGVDFINNYN